jgi:RNA polymerase sigma-70 factor (ECF subfamily)
MADGLGGDAGNAGDDRGLLPDMAQRWATRLYNFVGRFLGDFGVAEDLVQETMVRAVRTVARAPDELVGKALLYTIARSVCLDEIRRRMRTPKSVSLEMDPPARDGPMQERVRQAVSALPDPLREVLVLSVYEGFRYREIAEFAGCSIATVAARKAEALERMKEMLS